MRRLALRSGLWRPARTREYAPPAPIGAKLELLYACNLRCSFCYTDSPRHTIAGTAALDDDQWRQIAREAIEFGIVEVVITGGEPLMRGELALELVETFAEAGVGITLNSNGWFLDDAIADRLAEVPGLVVDISIDGPTAEIHDAGRGVPGSWRRAIEAVDRLIARDVGHQVVSVITPRALPEIDRHLELMHRLGVRSLRITPVAEIGAAARLRGQHVPRRKLLAAVRRSRRRRGETMRIVVQHGNAGIVPVRHITAPAALLVRPNGAVLTDSLHPFAYGNAARDGLAASWAQVRERWRDPRITAWAESISSSKRVRDASVVPYLSDELDITESDGTAPVKHVEAALPKRAEPRPGGPEPERLVRELALARRFVRTPARIGGGGPETYVRSLVTGRVARLNETARAILEALDGDSAGAAVERLAELYPGVDRGRLEEDVLDTVVSLSARGLIRAAAARRSSPAPLSGTSDLPGSTPGVDAAR